MRLLVVLSGGLDSSTLLYHLRAEGHELHALSVFYGQRHCRELDAAEGICALLGIPWELANLDAIADLLEGSALTDEEVEVPDGHYADESMKITVVPNRNMLLIAVALARCVSLDFDGVAYGAHAGDHAIYPDCRPRFAQLMDEAAGLCDFKPRRLLRPFVEMTKAQIVQRGAELGVPFEETWSCYKGEAKHCGSCGTCVERIEAFELAGVPDPTDYLLTREEINRASWRRNGD